MKHRLPSPSPSCKHRTNEEPRLVAASVTQDFTPHFSQPGTVFQQLPPALPLHFPLPNSFRGLAHRGEADTSKSGVCESSQAPTSGGPSLAGHGAMRELGNREASP